MVSFGRARRARLQPCQLEALGVDSADTLAIHVDRRASSKSRIFPSWSTLGEMSFSSLVPPYRLPLRMLQMSSYRSLQGAACILINIMQGVMANVLQQVKQLLPSCDVPDP